MTACLVAVGASCFSALVSAKPLDLELAWNVPAGCPSEAEVLDAIYRLTGGTESAGAPELSVQGDIESRGSQMVLRLIWSTGAMRAERTMASASCEELTRAAALVVALAADPSTAPAPAPTAPGVAREAEPHQAPEPANTNPPSLERSEPKPSPWIAYAPSPSSAESAASARERPARDARRARARAQFAFDVGSLPRAAEGAALGVGIPLGLVVAQAELSAFMPQRKTVSDGAADLWLSALSLRPCLQLALARLRVLPCAVAELDVLVGHGQDVDFRQGGAAWFPRFGAGAELAYSFSRQWAFVTDGWLLAAPFRPTFVLDNAVNVVPVHSPHALVGRWTTGLELRL